MNTSDGYFCYVNLQIFPCDINLLQPSIAYLNPLKTSENLEIL